MPAIPPFPRPDVDLPSPEQVTGVARDAAYAGVGLVALAAGRAVALSGRLADTTTDQARRLADTAAV